MSDFTFENPPLMQAEENRVMAEYLRRQFQKVMQAFGSSGAMTWRGEWADGLYRRNDVTLDNGWLAIANRETVTRPSPQPIGEVRNVIDMPGAPTFPSIVNVNSGSLAIGTRYTFVQDIYVRKFRYYIPASMVGFEVSYFLVLDPTTDPRFQQLIPKFTIGADSVDAWQELPLGLTFVESGREADLIGSFIPISGSTQFQYEWDYKRKNGDPPPKEAWHQSGQNTDQIRFHQEDTSETDRSTDLDNIGPGSTIEMRVNGTVWDVLDASKSGSVYTFIVQPAYRAGEDTSAFRFSYYAVQSMDYVREIDHYTTMPAVSGFVSLTGYNPDSNPVTLDQNAYGLDVQVQDVLLSDDWDFMAYTG